LFNSRGRWAIGAEHAGEQLSTDSQMNENMEQVRTAVVGSASLCMHVIEPSRQAAQLSLFALVM